MKLRRISLSLVVLAWLSIAEAHAAVVAVMPVPGFCFFHQRMVDLETADQRGGDHAAIAVVVAAADLALDDRA
jgi:hypothetical protein